jgi:hypothetical protein
MSKRRQQASARRVWALGRWRPTGGARTGLLRKNPPSAIDGFDGADNPDRSSRLHAERDEKTGANGRRNSGQAHLLRLDALDQPDGLGAAPFKTRRPGAGVLGSIAGKLASHRLRSSARMRVRRPRFTARRAPTFISL